MPPKRNIQTKQFTVKQQEIKTINETPTANSVSATVTLQEIEVKSEIN